MTDPLTYGWHPWPDYVLSVTDGSDGPAGEEGPQPEGLPIAAHQVGREDDIVPRYDLGGEG